MCIASKDGLQRWIEKHKSVSRHDATAQRKACKAKPLVLGLKRSVVAALRDHYFLRYKNA
jgi:hypothetical protein